MIFASVQFQSHIMCFTDVKTTLIPGSMIGTSVQRDLGLTWFITWSHSLSEITFSLWNNNQLLKVSQVWDQTFSLKLSRQHLRNFCTNPRFIMPGFFSCKYHYHIWRVPSRAELRKWLGLIQYNRRDFPPPHSPLLLCSPFPTLDLTQSPPCVKKTTFWVLHSTTELDLFPVTIYEYKLSSIR